MWSCLKNLQKGTNHGLRRIDMVRSQPSIHCGLHIVWTAQKGDCILKETSDEAGQWWKDSSERTNLECRLFSAKNMKTTVMGGASKFVGHKEKSENLIYLTEEQFKNLSCSYLFRKKQWCLFGCKKKKSCNYDVRKEENPNRKQCGCPKTWNVQSWGGPRTVSMCIGRNDLCSVGRMVTSTARLTLED